MSSEEEIRTLFKVSQTVRKMLKNRGYIVPEDDMTYQKFKTKMESGTKRGDLGFIAEKPVAGASSKTDGDVDMEVSAAPEQAGEKVEKILVILPDESKKLGVKDATKYHERLEKLQVHRCILITEVPVSGFVKTALMAVEPRYRYEVFTISELLVDITEHELVPKHVVLSDEEKKQILKRYNLKDSQLPRMMLDDPISRYFGLTRGQVVKIIRASETAGRYVTYRIVL